MNPAQTYTAAQIAALTRKSKRAVEVRLADVASSEFVLIAGNSTRAWAERDLPESLRAEMRTAKPGADAPALATIDQRHIDYARRLQAALAPSLARRHDLTISRDEFEQAAVADYQKAFGHAISPRHFRRLLDRTVTRDAGAEKWERLELYLPERPAQKTALKVAQEDFNFEELQLLIATFPVPAAPTIRERTYFWDQAFLILQDYIEGGCDRHSVRRVLLDFLGIHAPFLAESANALRTNFDRKYARWVAGGRQLAALDDSRKNGPARRAPELSEDERKDLLAFALKYGGGIDQGWRECVAAGRLRSEITEYYSHAEYRFRAPKKIWQAIRYDVKNLDPWMHGPRAAKLNGPFINRDPNSIASGDWDQSDDLTLPLIFWEDTPTGLWLGQGQFLAWIDVRSWFIYNFVLITAKGYSGFSIRNSWTEKTDTYGLCRKGVYVERGIWQKASVFVGRKNETPWASTEEGIRRLGIRIQHATLPRGKIIERLFGSIQDLFQAEPGYIGRSPLTDKYERVEKQMRLVRAGHEHPSKYFRSKAEWVERLAELCRKWNNLPGRGKYLNGLSPRECYEKHFTTELTKIPDSCRHLLSSNKIETVVGRNGITFRFGKQVFNYKASEALGALRGQKVQAWFNPQSPEILAVTDMNGKNPIAIPRSALVSYEATPEELAQAYSETAAFAKYDKETYRDVATRFTPHFETRRFRKNVIDSAATEITTVVEGGRRDLVTAEKEHNRALAKARKLKSALGMTLPDRAFSRTEAIEAADRLPAVMARLRKSTESNIP